MPRATSTSQTLSGIDRALDVLSLFAEADSRTLGVTEIANGLGVSKAVVHRTLATLRGRGFVVLEARTRRYSLGPQILLQGLAYLARLDVMAVSRDAVAALSQLTSETATLSIRVGHSRVHIDQVLPRREVRMQVELGVPYALHAGAPSRAFLAHLPEDEIEGYLDNVPLVKLTSRTVTDVRRLRRELTYVRAKGVATSFGERAEDAGAVAAPVFDRDGVVSGVICVCGPLERIRESADRSAELVLEQARLASERLGYRGDQHLSR